MERQGNKRTWAIQGHHTDCECSSGAGVQSSYVTLVLRPQRLAKVLATLGYTHLHRGNQGFCACNTVCQ